MKKLVTAFAACALAGLAFAQVESVNIVGYQTLSLPLGYKDVTSTFVPVGSDGTSIRLGDIVPNSVFDGGTAQFFNLNGNGAVSTTAVFYDGFGWFDFNTFDPLDDMTIPAGTGMFVYSSSTGAEFLVAGEVLVDSFALSVASGYTVVGNGSPVAITLGDISPSASFDGGTAQFFNANGDGTVATTAVYYDGFGWFDFNTFDPLGSMVLNPGDAFFAYAANGATFTFPDVL